MSSAYARTVASGISRLMRLGMLAGVGTACAGMLEGGEGRSHKGPAEERKKPIKRLSGSRGRLGMGGLALNFVTKKSLQPVDGG